MKAQQLQETGWGRDEDCMSVIHGDPGVLWTWHARATADSQRDGCCAEGQHGDHLAIDSEGRTAGRSSRWISRAPCARQLVCSRRRAARLGSYSMKTPPPGRISPPHAVSRAVGFTKTSAKLRNSVLGGSQ